MSTQGQISLEQDHGQNISRSEFCGDDVLLPCMESFPVLEMKSAMFRLCICNDDLLLRTSEHHDLAVAGQDNLESRWYMQYG